MNINHPLICRKTVSRIHVFIKIKIKPIISINAIITAITNDNGVKLQVFKTNFSISKSEHYFIHASFPNQSKNIPLKNDLNLSSQIKTTPDVIVKWHLNWYLIFNSAIRKLIIIQNSKCQSFVNYFATIGHMNMYKLIYMVRSSHLSDWVHWLHSQHFFIIQIIYSCFEWLVNSWLLIIDGILIKIVTRILCESFSFGSIMWIDTLDRFII